MLQEQTTKSQDERTTDAIRRHLGGALDGFIASLLAMTRPVAELPALQPVPVLVHARRRRRPPAA